MKKIIFAYNTENNSWRKVKLTERPENMPIIFIVQYKVEATNEKWLKAWCPLHHAYEEIISHKDDSLITVTGCHLGGFCVKTDILIRPNGYNIWQHHNWECVAYWSLEKSNQPGTVQYSKHVMRLSYTWEQDTSNNLIYLVPHMRYWEEYVYDNKNCIPRNIPQNVKAEIKTILKIKDDDIDCAEKSVISPIHIGNIQEKHQQDYSYTKTDYQIYEKNINGYNFRLIPSCEAFRNISYSISGIISARTNETLFDEAKALVAVEHHGRYLLTLILSGSKVQHEYGAYFNPSILAAVKLYAVTDCWAKSAGIDKKYLSNRDYESIKDYLIIGKPSSKGHTSLKNILELSEDYIKPGYYLDFHLCLSAARVPDISSYGKIHDDEHRLTEALPFAKRLFAAAWSGNPEAQYVMHLLYSTYSCFSNTNPRKARYWLSEASRNGWRPFEKLRMDNSRLFN